VSLCYSIVLSLGCCVAVLRVVGENPICVLKLRLCLSGRGKLGKVGNLANNFARCRYCWQRVETMAGDKQTPLIQIRIIS
jgi:hypothetical protein